MGRFQCEPFSAVEHTVLWDGLRVRRFFTERFVMEPYVMGRVVCVSSKQIEKKTGSQVGVRFSCFSACILFM
jgi:hypothetical protein